MKDQHIGIITEQGDLGLGFDELSQKDEKAYNEAIERQTNDNTSIINEGNKNTAK